MLWSGLIRDAQSGSKLRGQKFLETFMSDSCRSNVKRIPMVSHILFKHMPDRGFFLTIEIAAFLISNI